MTDSDKVFSGSIPEIYDEYLVPLIFEGYAADLVRRVTRVGPKDVLETAAGSGVVPRALLPSLGEGARYVVTDLNQPMLDRAAARQGSDGRISYQQADALELPFGDGEFDAVCCQFGAMFFPDRIKGYSEARRVLKPGGIFCFNVWDRIEENVFANKVTQAAGELYPDDPPLFLARTPHGYHDTEQIERDLRAAGFAEVHIETIAKDSRAPSPHHPAYAYCQGTPLRGEIEERDPEGLERVTLHATDAIARSHGEGQVSAKVQAHVVTATT